MGCSVVIPALNDDEALSLLLPKLAPYGYEIVVDDMVGLARAVRRGIERATGEKVAVMDCDGYHPPEVLPLLFRLLDECDLVYASRDRWPPGVHGMVTAMGNWVGRMALGVDVRDVTGGYFAAWRHRLLELPDSVWTGYGDYGMAMLVQARYRRWTVALPDFTPGERVAGNSHTRVLAHSIQYTRRIYKILKEPLDEECPVCGGRPKSRTG